MILFKYICSKWIAIQANVRFDSFDSQQNNPVRTWVEQWRWSAERIRLWLTDKEHKAYTHTHEPQNLTRKRICYLCSSCSNFNKLNWVICLLEKFSTMLSFPTKYTTFHLPAFIIFFGATFFISKTNIYENDVFDMHINFSDFLIHTHRMTKQILSCSSSLFSSFICIEIIEIF